VGRPREFDEGAALEAATQLFWCQGYQGVSLDALTAETGVAKQSLYNTFGDKRSLYLRCLRHYQETNTAAMQEVLGKVRPIETAFERLFASVLDEDDAAKRRGCLMVNSAMELAPSDAGVAELVAKNQRALEETFRRALAAARDRGEAVADPTRTARFLVGCMQGLRVMAKTDPGSAALEDLVRVAVAAIRG